jgi:TatD DNase family protein
MILPLDAHTHIDPGIPPGRLTSLRACIVAVTRSLSEFASVQDRSDPTVLWAVGCHPGLATAIGEFSVQKFEQALNHTCVVGEVGIDRTSRVPLTDQIAAFDQILSTVMITPRLLSIHSYRATDLVLDALERYQPAGVVLHWWLGTEDETRAALRLGAYFSVNAAQALKWDGLRLLPSERILLETDHPFGDRSEPKPRQPGLLSTVEERVASIVGQTPGELRVQAWRNFDKIAGELSLHSMLPHEFQVQVLAS